MSRWRLAFIALYVLLSIQLSSQLLAASNATLEERIASLEETIASLRENLTITDRRLDIALSRTISLISRYEELERTAEGLRANLTRLTEAVSPSAPEAFHIERIRRLPDGNYSVVLRWRSNPSHERVVKYAVWYARIGEEYMPGKVVNQTGRGIQKSELTGFKGGEEVLFKIFAKNEAGQGKPSYREVRIRNYAPVLMSRLKIAGGVAVILVVGGIIAWIKPGRESSAREGGSIKDGGG